MYNAPQSSIRFLYLHGDSDSTRQIDRKDNGRVDANPKQSGGMNEGSCRAGLHAQRQRQRLVAGETELGRKQACTAATDKTLLAAGSTYLCLCSLAASQA